VSQGFRVVRFWNPEFLRHQDAIARKLLAELDGGESPSPSPLPRFASSAHFMRRWKAVSRNSRSRSPIMSSPGSPGGWRWTPPPDAARP
jgi:hypothetical protein